MERSCMDNDEEYPRTITNPEGIVFTRHGNGKYVFRTSTGGRRVLSQWIVNCIVSGAKVADYEADYPGKPVTLDRQTRRKPEFQAMMIGAD